MDSLRVQVVVFKQALVFVGLTIQMRAFSKKEANRRECVQWFQTPFLFVCAFCNPIKGVSQN